MHYAYRYTICYLCDTQNATSVIVELDDITVLDVTLIGILLALFVNVRYGVLLKNADTSK